MKETWPIIFSFLSKIQIKIENLDRASGVQDRNRGLDEHFSKNFENCPTLNLMMVFKVLLGSSRMSFEALTASLTLTSVLVRSKSRLRSLRVLESKLKSLRVKKMFDLFALTWIKEKKRKHESKGVNIMKVYYSMFVNCINFSKLNYSKWLN